MLGEVISVASSIASIVLAVVAIALSVFFYTQSKNTEGRVNESLSEIRTQTDSLQKLTGRWMDRLTKYVTTPRSETTDSANEIKQILESLPDDIAKQVTHQEPTTDTALFSELISLYIALYYYAGVANFFSQQSLPPLERFDDTPAFSELVSRVVDQSAGDFQHMANVLQHTDQEALQQSALFHLAETARSVYRDRVATSTQAYAKRAEQDQS